MYISKLLLTALINFSPTSCMHPSFILILTGQFYNVINNTHLVLIKLNQVASSNKTSTNIVIDALHSYL